MSGLLENVKLITIGSPNKYLSAYEEPIIHQLSFDKTKNIDNGKTYISLKFLAGGKYADSKGYIVTPTVYQADSPDHWLFNYENFGPVLAIYVYPDAEWKSILEKVDQSSGGFTLTNAVFANSRAAIREAEDALQYSVGNFYIIRKTTVALIG
ncbi:hypothetical protein B0J11DRAFT_512965 [Dendryphion nanum]|uniref:Aldehyde dehydrogenase domain-containing protein n=1 Tax=Dendryphion nanum TaxID=256645 RepID=A0A9P9I6Z4_9PLEO|nr:hypothetical protein B0J11DRAFT_512965 [Dendryphion nanum]